MYHKMLLPIASSTHQKMGSKVSPHVQRTKKTKTQQIRPPMIDTSELALGPRKALEIDILRNLPSSEGCTNVIMAMDVFSRHFSPCPTAKCDAATVGRCITDITTRHAYLPTKITAYKGNQLRAATKRDNCSRIPLSRNHKTRTNHRDTRKSAYSILYWKLIWKYKLMKDTLCGPNTFK